MRDLVKINIFVRMAFFLFTSLFMACPNNSTSKDILYEKLEDMVIKSVTFDENPAYKDSIIETNKTEGEVKITFHEAYQGLKVKINDEIIAFSGKILSKKISNIKENGTMVKIEATAKGKNPLCYIFTVKKLRLSEIGIESVTFEDMPCQESNTIETEKSEGIVKVTFLEEYVGLQATINENTINPVGKIVTAKISNISFEGIDVNINATATDREAKVYRFKLKRIKSFPVIRQLTFTGKNINPSAPYYKDGKDYYLDKAPFIKEIKADGSTKIGDTKEERVKITLKYTGTPSNPKLEIKNTTTDVIATSSTASPTLSIIDASIDLKKGDNNLVITYQEDDKHPFVLKVIVGYEEAEYEPISRVVVHGKWYTTKDAFEKLENGSESIIVAGKANIEMEVEMLEAWYNEDSWSLKVDNIACQKANFQKTSWYPDAKWTAKKSILLTENATKQLKIEFENASRSYKKEYKVNVVHYTVNELDSLIFVDASSTAKIAGKSYNSFKFDSEKSYYKAKTNFMAEDRVEKAHLFACPKETDVIIKYAFSATLAEPNDISSWQEASKKNVSYIDGSQTITKETCAIENQILNYGNQYLYLLLEKGAVKTYYITEIIRNKAKTDDVTCEQQLVYQDNGGTKLTDEYPLASKGLIRVLPKNPRATVNLVTPEAKAFEKKSDGWFECQIELPEEKTRFSYNIIGEDTTKIRLYNDAYYQAFRKAPIIKEFKFAYEQNGSEYQRTDIGDFENVYYLSFDKKLVKDNKIYLFVKTYKNLEITTVTGFTQIYKAQGETSTNYTFALDVAPLVDNSQNKKEYSLPLTLNGTSCNPLKTVVFLQDEIVKAMYVRGNRCLQLLEGNKWVCKADMNISGRKRLVIDLYLLQNETAKSTNRSIKVFQGSDEKEVSIDENAKNELSFFYNNFNIADKEKITLKIQYFVNKTQTTTPTKEYTLEIEDL